MRKFEVTTRNALGRMVGSKIVEADTAAEALAARKAEVLQRIIARPVLGEMIRVQDKQALRDKNAVALRTELDTTFTWNVREVL